MQTQEQAIETWLPVIRRMGITYEKFTEIEARLAVEGETVITRTAAGVETTNTAKAGDFVVKNLTKAGEQYILPSKKLAARYTELPNAKPFEPGWVRYKAHGEVCAIIYSGPNTEFMASWGEPMQLHTNDYLCTPLPQMGEVYRIAEQEFGETYRQK
jgi:hypothetical protein